jgi:hypothetical protein
LLTSCLLMPIDRLSITQIRLLVPYVSVLYRKDSMRLVEAS